MKVFISYHFHAQDGVAGCSNFIEDIDFNYKTEKGILRVQNELCVDNYFKLSNRPNKSIALKIILLSVSEVEDVYRCCNCELKCDQATADFYKHKCPTCKCDLDKE